MVSETLTPLIVSLDYYDHLASLKGKGKGTPKALPKHKGDLGHIAGAPEKSPKKLTANNKKAPTKASRAEKLKEAAKKVAAQKKKDADKAEEDAAKKTTKKEAAKAKEDAATKKKDDKVTAPTFCLV